MNREEIKQRIPLLVWIIVVVTFMAIPLKIISYGYLPTTDALRHAAKVLSGKSWPEILVMRPELSIDHSPGWHALLAGAQQITGWNADSLVVFSVCFLFLLFSLGGLIFLQRPEVWAMVWLIGYLTFYDIVLRAFLGRPFLLTATVLMILLRLWTREGGPTRQIGRLVLTTLLIAASVWIHGAWYLFLLVVMAFLLAGKWRESTQLFLCWIGGVLIGSSLTGHPFAFLQNAILMGKYAFENVRERILVTEFRSFDGDSWSVLVIVLVLVWRVAARRWNPSCICNPVFALMVLCWILGFKASRFWSDWGSPALMVWLAGELQDALKQHVSLDSPRRLLLTTAACAGLFLAFTSDHRGRWTYSLDTQYLQASNPETEGWMPEKGGIVYSSEMLFYQLFFKNPQGDWRYILGYEPALMPAEDLKILREIQLKNDRASWLPWIRKMRSEDRLMSRSDFSRVLPELEWKNISGIWIGRLPRNAVAPVEQK